MTVDQHTSPFAIRFQNIAYRIKQKIILEHITLDIKQGEIFGILGPNGAGKTTMLDLVTGLRTPFQGSITIFNEQIPPGSYKKLRKRIGVVFQETALYDDLTIFENLQFSASLYNIAHPKQKITEISQLMGLSDRVNDVVKTLSGGLRRRVAIARAFLHSPDLLVIDEPTLGVDVDTRHAIWAHLRLLRSTGVTVLVATNYLDEALALCDTVAVLKKGTVLTTAPPTELVARAGSCLDITCHTEDLDKLIVALQNVPGILHTEKTLTGLSVFLKGDSVPDTIINLVLQTIPITGFRTRAADLAEVFRVLEVAA